MRLWNSTRPTVTGLYICPSCLYRLDHDVSNRQWRLRTFLTTTRKPPLSRPRTVDHAGPFVKRAVSSYSTTTPRGAKKKPETTASPQQPTSTKSSLFRRVTSFFTSRKPALSDDEHRTEDKIGENGGETATFGSTSLGGPQEQAQEEHAEHDVGEKHGRDTTVGSDSLADDQEKLQRAQDLATLNRQKRAERHELRSARHRLSLRRTPDAGRQLRSVEEKLHTLDDEEEKMLLERLAILTSMTGESASRSSSHVFNSLQVLRRRKAKQEAQREEKSERLAQRHGKTEQKAQRDGNSELLAQQHSKTEQEAQRDKKSELLAQHRYWYLQQTSDAQEQLHSVREKLRLLHGIAVFPEKEKVLIAKLALCKSRPDRASIRRGKHLRSMLRQYYGTQFSREGTVLQTTTVPDAVKNTPEATEKELGDATSQREVQVEDSAALQQTPDAQGQLRSSKVPIHQNGIGSPHKKMLLKQYANLKSRKGQTAARLRERLRLTLSQHYGVQFRPGGSVLRTTTVDGAGNDTPRKTKKTSRDARTPRKVMSSPSDSANSTPPLSGPSNPADVVQGVPGVIKQEPTASENRGNKTHERVLAGSDIRNTTSSPVVSDLNTEPTKDTGDREGDVNIYHDQHFNSMKDAMLNKRPVEPTSQGSDTSLAAPPSLARRGKAALLIQSLQPTELHFEPLDIEQPPVPALAHGLDRVLFNRGVYALQDDASKVYNFDPYLQKVMSVADFDFNALKQYKTSSEDEILSKVAREHGRKYVGSTSSMTSSLSHFHFLLSNWRPLNMSMLSAGFDPSGGNSQVPSTNFTLIQKAPSAMFLRYKNGVYAIDADKEYDDGNVLMLLGKSLEKLLTMPVSEFERYRKGDLRGVSEEERTAPESYHYSTQGDFLMRSQLDAYDPRLPGTGMFDLKTRAVLSIRMRSKEYQDMVGYQLKAQQGGYESYEREYYDMIRSTLLKYSLQARMGRMDGIFMAYHNVEEIFGFQYMNMQEIDRALHGQEDPCLGDQEFRYSVALMNRILNEATARFPEQSIRFHFETRPRPERRPSFMYIFAEPMSETEINTIQSSQKARIAEFEREIMGVDVDEAASLKAKSQAVAAAAATSRPSPSGDDEDAAVATSPASKTAHYAQETEPNTSDTSNKRPLLGMTLTLRSKVKNVYVERPENLRPNQQWDMEFSLQEISEAQVHTVYAEVKHRRRVQFTKHDIDEDEDPEDLSTMERRRREWSDHFTAMLRRMSLKGAKLREKREKEMEGREKVVVGLPYTPRVEPAVMASEDESAASEEVSSVATGEAEVVPEPKIENADEYMGWLYKDTKSRLPRSSPPSEPFSERIESTDDYMQWLYHKS